MRIRPPTVISPMLRVGLVLALLAGSWSVRADQGRPGIDPSAEDAGLAQREAFVAAQREETYEWLKVLGAPLEGLGAALDLVEQEAERGHVDDYAIARVVALVPSDPELTTKAATVARTFARSVMTGHPMSDGAVEFKC